MSTSWVILSDQAEVTGHVEALSNALKKAGLENSGRFIEVQPETLFQKIQDLRAEGVTHFRLSGTLPGHILEHFPNSPSNLRALKAADSIVFDANGTEWMKNNLYDGFSRFIAHEIKTVDLNGAAFVIGTGSEARAVVASLSRTGFNRILVTDIDEKGGDAFVEDLRKAFFSVQFQFTPRSLVMHLPGVYSVAVNTVCAKTDATEMSELFYFNFLKAGAFWIEVPCATENSALIQEARNAGANVHTGLEVLAHWDVVWAESCFKRSLNIDEYRSALESQTPA